MEPIASTFDASRFFLNALKQATPSKAVQIELEIAKWNIRFTLDEASVTPDFWADVDTGEINVPRRALFRLKAHAYATYAVFVALLSTDEHVDEVGVFKTRLRSASELLTWAVRTDIATALGDGSTFSLGRVPERFDTLCCECLDGE
jgi:hypothetical protein